MNHMVFLIVTLQAAYIIVSITVKQNTQELSKKYYSLMK